MLLTLTMFALAVDPAPLIDDALTAWNVPGVAVVIVDGERTLYLAGHGLREAGNPERITAETVFPLASCTKAFTTAVLASLVDEKKIAWDDPVRKHLRDFHLSDPHADADVRIDDLVAHRTGVAPHDLLWYRAAWDQDEMIRRLAFLPLDKPFRTAMQYQSVMFMAAGKAASNAAGKPWADLMTERLFTPLEMKNATLTTLKLPTDCAMPHTEFDGKLTAGEWYAMKVPDPAGSLNCSASDLAPWLRLQLNDGKHGGRQLISAANLAHTRRPHVVIPVDEGTRKNHPFTKQMSYGMGWVIQDYRGELLVSHGGVIDGFRAHITLIPEKKFALAILSNREQTRMNQALSNMLVDQFLEAPKYDWNKHYGDIVSAEAFAARQSRVQAERQRRQGTSPTLALADYVGEYTHPAYGAATVSLKDGSLTLSWSTFTGSLKHWQDDVFRANDEELGRTPVIFHVEQGKSAALTAVGTRFVRK